MSKLYLKVSLTSTLYRSAFEIVPEAISEDGRFIYVYYVTTFPFPQNPLEVELFENVNGTLVSIASVTSVGDAFFSLGGSIDDGGANRDYTLFTVIDDNGQQGANSGRIRLFSRTNNTFNTLATTYVNNVLATSMGGGFFTDDNKYIVVTYTDVTTNNLVSLLLSTRVTAGTLSILDSFSIHGSISNNTGPLTNNPAVFRLCKCGKKVNYYLLGFSTVQFGTTPLLYQSPALLNVYEIAFDKFKFIDSAVLNQFPTSYFAFDPLRHVRKNTNIIVSTNLALLPSQPSIYRNTTDSQSFTGKGENLVQYNFDGCKLVRTIAKRFDTTLIVGNYYRDGKTFALGNNNGIINNLLQTTPQLSTIVFEQAKEDECKPTFKQIDGFITGPPNEFSPLFSGNGKWLFVSGGNIPQADGVTLGLNNINLYRVHSNIEFANEC